MTTFMSNATRRDAILMHVLSALYCTGWEISAEGGAAIATTVVKTVNVSETAFAFLSDGDGYHNTLSFSFYSEGRNQTATDSVLIPYCAPLYSVFNLALKAAEQAKISIRASFGVRMAMN